MILPPELILQILKYNLRTHTLFSNQIDLKQNKELLSYSLIDHSWRLVAESLLFKHIHLNVWKFHEVLEKLYNSIESTEWGKEVSTLSVTFGIGNTSRPFVTNQLVATFPNLKELVLIHCPTVDFETISELQHLQSFSISGGTIVGNSIAILPSLLHLSIQSPLNYGPPFLEICESLPNLQALYLVGVSFQLDKFNRSLVTPLKALSLQIETLRSWNRDDYSEKDYNIFSQLKLLNITHNKFHDDKDWLERQKLFEYYLPLLTKAVEILSLFYWDSTWGIRHRLTRNFTFNNLKKLIYIGPIEVGWFKDYQYNFDPDDQEIDLEEIQKEQADIGVEKGYKVEWLPFENIDTMAEFWRAVNNLKLDK